MREFPAQYNLQPSDVLYFSHIPKTAGMTFRTIVEDQFRAEEVCPATLNAQLAQMPPEQLNRYRLFRGHLGLIDLPRLLPEKNIVDVTVLREPIARVVSHYEYIRRMPGDPHYPAVKDMTLAEFCQNLTVGNIAKNIQVYHVAKTLRFDLDDLAPEEIFALSKQSLDRFAFVGLVERFQDSLFLLSYIFGWKPIINTRRENAAQAKKSLDEIPAETIAAIKASSALDAELYDYAREIFEARFTQMTQNLLAHYGRDFGLDPNTENLTDRQYEALLNLHYQQRFLSQETPAADVYAYNFALPLRGSGWQRREYPTDEQPLYRWIGPGTTATLDLPMQAKTDTDFILEFCIVCPQVTPPDILDSLRVEVNQTPIEITTMHSEDGARFLHGSVPGSMLNQSPFITCAFKVDRVSPLTSSDGPVPDRRSVGVALNLVQVFPTALMRQYSALAALFNPEGWLTVADFLRQHTKPHETVIAPLVFRAALENPVQQDYPLFLKQNQFNWLVIHKGKIDDIDAVLVKLALRGFAPVFADDVFVVYTNHKLPKLPYNSIHVKPLYVDRLRDRFAILNVVLPPPKPQVTPL